MGFAEWFNRKAGGKFPRLTEAQRDDDLAILLGGAIPDHYVIFNSTAGRYQFWDQDAGAGAGAWLDHTGEQDQEE